MKPKLSNLEDEAEREPIIIPMTGPDGKPSPEFLAWADGMLRKDSPPKNRTKKPRRATRR